jgi:transcriptional regulator with XRE-family HTH domain
MPHAGVSRSRSSGNAPWAQWMRDVGAQVRRVRDFLGLSQEQVARLAGVSQGAVSRFEAGRGLATPLLVVVRIHLVLMQRLQEIDPALLNEDLRRLIASSDALISPPLNGIGHQVMPIADDAGLDELIQLYRELPERKRDALRSIVHAAAVALRTAS